MKNDGVVDEVQIVRETEKERLSVAETEFDGCEGVGEGSGLALDRAGAFEDGEAFELGFPKSGVVFDDVVQEGLGPLEAGKGRGRIAEVTAGAATLDFSHTEVGIGELAFEFPIVGGAEREIVEVFDAILGEELAGFEGTGEFADGMFDIEDDGGGKLANLVEALLREAGLADGDDGAGDHGPNGEGSEGDGDAIAADELTSAVEEGIWAGEDGAVIKMAADVFGESFNGFVAAVGIFLHGAQNDDVEVSGEAFGEGPVGAGGSGAGGKGFVRADRALEGQGSNLVDLVGFGTGEELVKDGAEGVDVGSDADGFAEDLFGAGVVRRQHADALGFGRFAGFGEEEFGDAEIEEFGGTGAVDEDVAGLDIAMDD